MCVCVYVHSMCMMMYACTCVSAHATRREKKKKEEVACPQTHNISMAESGPSTRQQDVIGCNYEGCRLSRNKTKTAVGRE